MTDVRLMTDDACKALAKIPNDTIDGAVIDPPYGKKVQRFKWDKILPPLRVWEETYRVLKPGAHIAVFCFPDMAHRLAIDLEDVGFEIRNVWVWDYGHGILISQPLTDELDARLRPQHESIVVARKKLDCRTITENIEKWGTGGLPTRDTLEEGMRSYTVFEYGKATDWERDLGADALPLRPVLEKPRKTGAFHKTEKMRRNNHYCVKPVALLTHLLKVVAKPGDTVTDPFMGSGSAGMAAVWAGMNYIGVDMNAHFVRIAKERIAYAQSNPMPDRLNPSLNLAEPREEAKRQRKKAAKPSRPDQPKVRAGNRNGRAVIRRSEVRCNLLGSVWRADGVAWPGRGVDAAQSAFPTVTRAMRLRLGRRCQARWLPHGGTRRLVQPPPLRPSFERFPVRRDHPPRHIIDGSGHHRDQGVVRLPRDHLEGFFRSIGEAGHFDGPRHRPVAQSPPVGLRLLDGQIE